MDESQYETELAEIKIEMERLQQELTLTQSAFMESAKAFIVDWSVQIIEEAVTSKPEVTKNLGLERLRALKTDLGQLKSNLPELVVKKFAQDKLRLSGLGTPKNREGGQLLNYEIWRLIDDNLDKCVRELMGHAGSLMVTYGFVDLSRNKAWEKVVNATPPQYRYKHGYSMSETMREERKACNDLLALLMIGKGKLDVLEACKVAAEAKSLWDSV